MKEDRSSTESRSTASSGLASRGAVFHVSEEDAGSLRACFKGLKDSGRRHEGLTLYRYTAVRCHMVRYGKVRTLAGTTNG